MFSKNAMTTNVVGVVRVAASTVDNNKNSFDQNQSHRKSIFRFKNKVNIE